MVPFVAGRGHSFKGAGLYYLHDKDEQTSERVAWTHTHNLPTNDPEKALKWMAYTAKSMDYLKEQAGIRKTGRKPTTGQVYAFSLSWHPDEKPSKDQMLEAAFDTLDRLGLKEHEVLIVAHQETKHPHIHLICNLVNPKDGRTAVPSYDRLTLSNWAQEYEAKNGKIYCKQRVTNNKERKTQAKQNRQLGLVKSKQQRLSSADIIQKVYARSDSGKAFQAALNQAGLTLAKGDRRGFVIVDKQGKAYSLSRQLEGQRAADIKSKLSDIDEKSLLSVNAVMDKMDKLQNVSQEKSIVALANSNKPIQNKNDLGTLTRKEQNISNEFLDRLDKVREWEQHQDRKRDKLDEELDKFYNRKQYVKLIGDLDKMIEKSSGVLGSITNRTQKLKDEKERLVGTLESIDKRILERKEDLEREIKKSWDSEFSKQEKSAYSPKQNIETDEQNKNQDNFYKRRGLDR